MNNSDLISKLESVPVPERTEEYWSGFPSCVRRQLHRPAAPAELHTAWLPQFSWKCAAGTACLIFGLSFFDQPLIAGSTAIFQKERAARQQLAELPQHLRILMADNHGMYYLIADKE